MFRHQAARPREGTPTLERWHRRRARARSTRIASTTAGQEFPRSTSAASAAATRFGYAVAVAESEGIVGTESVLIRHDLEHGTTSSRSFGRGAACSVRPCSCLGPTDADESDGWLMTLVYSAETVFCRRCTSSMPTTSMQRRKRS